MLQPPYLPPFNLSRQRSLTDQQFIASQLIPSSGSNSNSSPAFDTTSLGLNSTTDYVALQISWPVIPNLINNTDSLTITVQATANSSNAYTAISRMGTTVLTGNGSGNYAAGSVIYKIDPSAAEYLQINVARTANGGADTGVAITSQLLF
jgi:hypothetical protein